MDNNSVAVSIVTYNPNLETLQHTLKVFENFKVIVFDNGSDIQSEIARLKTAGTEFIFSKTNIGIAAALNTVFSMASKLEIGWVLTLDQDSMCDKELLLKLLTHINVFKKSAIICPEIYDINMKGYITPKGAGEYMEVSRCITSASLTNVEAWRAVNGFDESMFIDSVDFDFCYRLKRLGYKIIQVNNVCLYHSIGKIEKHKFLVKTVYVKNHSAFRKYYIGRNIIYFARKQSKLKVIRAYFQVVYQSLLILLYEKDKRQKIRKLLIGFHDGKKQAIVEKWK